MDACQLFLCAFVVTLPTATTLKITQEAKKQRLEESLTEFLAEIESEQQQRNTELAPLIVDEHEQKRMIELSARGMSILRGLAAIEGETALVKRDKEMESEGIGSNEGSPVSRWLKIRNMFSGWFG